MNTRLKKWIYLLAAGYIVSLGGVTAFWGYRILSYQRLAFTALRVFPLITGYLFFLHQASGYNRQAFGRKGVVICASACFALSLLLAPFYQGMGRTIATMILLAAALFAWTTFFAPLLSADKTRLATLIPALLTGLAGVGLFLYMSFFVRMYGDDFCYTIWVQVDGFLAANVNFFLQWSGRIFSNLLKFTFSNVPAIIFTQILLFSTSIFVSLFFTLKGTTRRRWLHAALAALCLPLVIFIITPDIYKSVYWISSSVLVLPIPILLPLLFWMLFGLESRPALRGWLALLLAFLISTTNEIAAIPVFILCGVYSSWAVIPPKRNRENRLTGGLALGGAVLGLVVALAAPGNYARHAAQGYPPFPGLVALIKANTVFAFSLLRRMGEEGGWFLVALVVLLGYLNERPIAAKPKVWLALGVGVLTILCVWCCFLPGTYAMGVELPPRSELIPVALLVFGAYAFGCCLPRFDHIPYVRMLLSAAAFLLFILQVQAVVQKTALLPPMVQFAQDWDARDEQMRTGDVPVYRIEIPWDYQEQEFQCVVEYYGITR